jgi:hypothetical protein
MAELEICHHCGVASLRNLYGIAQVIAVTVGHENIVYGSEFPLAGRGFGVSREKRIDQGIEAFGLHVKRRMAQIGNPNHARNLLPYLQKLPALKNTLI